MASIVKTTEKQCHTYPHIERTQESETETQVGRVQIVEVVECIHYFMQRVGKGDTSCCVSMATDLGVNSRTTY